MQLSDTLVWIIFPYTSLDPHWNLIFHFWFCILLVMLNDRSPTVSCPCMPWVLVRHRLTELLVYTTLVPCVLQKPPVQKKSECVECLTSSDIFRRGECLYVEPVSSSFELVALRSFICILMRSPIKRSANGYLTGHIEEWNSSVWPLQEQH